ncbi:DUF6875 domain-containing protein [Thermoactinomyces sp. DSM 45892]|uniref:DUF6875 domain-containing protein n=1 Tax=Thermoactinomyces sp. DSM 45892 TaxID=1882753 RepID=UPI00089AB37F|nr:hypothetical protein [Thermoactinomyces sp. DSM 45892]SDY10810.1 hypothetical protein SAMN05444416_10223 [Thermoactinomyces sp. DSM 45892]
MTETKKWLSVRELKEKIDKGVEFKEKSWIPATIDWIYNTIAVPDVQMNRKGAVCPFVPYSLDRDLLYLTSLERPLSKESEAIEYMHTQLQDFLDIEPCQPNEDASYKSLLVAFPHCLEDSEKIVKEVRVAIKPHFLRFGVTCGEFYSSNNDRSVRNSDMLIAQSPVPLIAIRYLTPHDKLFLKTQPDLYEIFRHWKGDGLDEK